MENARLDWAHRWLRTPKRLYIDGCWQEATGTNAHDAVNPANGQRLASVTHAADSDVDYAVRGARGACDSGPWRRLSRRERARVLQRIGAVVCAHRAELATLIASGPNVGRWPLARAARKPSISVPWSESQPPRTGRLMNRRKAAIRTIPPRQSSSRPA